MPSNFTILLSINSWYRQMFLKRTHLETTDFGFQDFDLGKPRALFFK
jgi:hypothetical protein